MSDTKQASKIISKMFNEKEEVIVRISDYYDFYPKEILTTMVSMKLHNYGTYKNKRPEKELLIIRDNIVGFYIKGYCQKTGNCMLEYIFILPEFRRNGIFTNLIQTLKAQEDEIWIDTDKPEMIRCLNKLGFKCNGKCLNNKELSFRWNK